MTNPPQKLPMHTPDLTDIEKMTGETRDLVADNIAQLKALFPEVMTEGKINFDTLQELLGAEVEKAEEHYNFTWHGKRAALRLAQTPSLGTLRPVKDESPDWDNTQNVFIEGDNLEVLKLLQKSYFGKVKMIYIDPPYNTGNDFVYEDDFADNIKNYHSITGQLDEEGYKTSTAANSNSDGRYHTNWLNMMYPRLRLARNLLRDDGVIFISIDDNEQANLKKLCDEIFGEINLIIQICHKSRASVSNDKIISPNHNIILAYAKNERLLFSDRAQFGLEPNLEGFNNQDEVGSFRLVPVDGPGGAKKGNPHYTFEGVTGYWRFSKETMQEKFSKGLVVKVGNNLQQKYYKSQAEESRRTTTSWWDEKFYTSEATKKLNNLIGGNYFDTPKPVELIKKMLTLSTKDDDIILDFFAGSGTTAHATMQLNSEDGGNRKFICVQLPEATKEKSEAFQAGYKNIAEIAKERIRLAGKKIKDAGGLAHTPDLGFKVFRLDTSNLERWDPYPDHEDIEPNLADAVDYLKDDREEEDLLFELLLKCGLDLAVPIETRTVAGNKQIYSIGLGKLVVCLDTDITTEVAEAIAELNAELKPEDGMRVILRDEGFKDDCAKTNSIITLKTRGIKDVKSL